MAVIRRKTIGKAIEELAEVHRISTLKTASFSSYIKRKIRLWALTWIEEPVKHVIDNLQEELDRDDGDGYC